MVALVYIVYAAASALICVTSSVLNSLVCLVFYNNKQLLNPPNIFIFSVAVSDLLYAATCLPLLVITNAYSRWIYGVDGCKATGFIATLSGLTSIVHLAAAAYERYTALVYPLKRTKDCIIRRTICYSLALWVYALFWSAAPLCGWSGFEQEGLGTSCAVKWQSRAKLDLSYNISLLVACFVFPVSVMCFSYSKCCQEISKAARRARTTWGKSSPHTRKTFEMERKMVLLFGVMTVAFLGAWTPYAVVSVMSMIAGPDVVSDVATSVPAYLAKSSACFNPIIYVFIYRRLRKPMFSWIRRRSSYSQSRKLSRETGEVRQQEVIQQHKHVVYFASV